jgi:glycerate-2-kinase
MGIEELKKVSQTLQKAVLSAADPSRAMKRALVRTPGGFTLEGREFSVRGRLAVVAVGKASAAMAVAASDILGPLVTEGCVIIPHGYSTGHLPPVMQVFSSGHPVPDEKGLAAAHHAAVLAAGLGEKDTCLFLVSGGSSSLLPDPLPGVSLQDLVETTTLLLKCGAGIRELNAVRKHLSAIAGGRLAASCDGAVVTCAVSDVVGDDISVVGSGPTVPDPSTFSDALAVLARYELIGRVPGSVRAALEHGRAGLIDETPKALPDRHAAFVIASSAQAVDAASVQARKSGFAPFVLTTTMSGEARDAGRLLASAALEARRFGRPAPAPACIIAAGETTVTVRGPGTGGRNQEIALAAALLLRDERGILLTSFATDGKEGNSDAAGAYASAATIAAGERAGLDAGSCLARNDANAFLAAAGDLIVTGPTGTNVNDISFVLVEKR